MLADLHQHIYKGCDDAAHCPPFMTASWDYHDQTKVLHREGRLSSYLAAAKSRRRSRSHTRCRSRPLALRDWSVHTCCSLPSMLLSCTCGRSLSPGTNSMPWLSLMVNVPAHARSSHSTWGRARATLNMEEMLDDDFQNPHTPVCCIVPQDRGGSGEPAT